jgi:hypothetical protein
MRVVNKLQPTTRRRLVCLGIILLLIPAGIVCRFVPIGLPVVIVKYGGSFLWAALVYWCLALLLACAKPIVIAVLALLISTAVEFFKLFNPPAIDAFRDTFAGKVLLGRYFSFRDIAVYCIAICIALWIDHTALHSRTASKE